MIKPNITRSGSSKIGNMCVVCSSLRHLKRTTAQSVKSTQPTLQSGMPLRHRIAIRNFHSTIVLKSNDSHVSSPNPPKSKSAGTASPVKPRNLLQFSLEFEQPAKTLSSDTVNMFKPSKTMMTRAEIEELKESLSNSFTKPLLMDYLRRNHRSHLSLNSKKTILIDEIISGWGISVTEDTYSGLKELEETTIETPCTARDLFFIYGQGETLRLLMLEGNVDVRLNKGKKTYTVSGMGNGVSKTLTRIHNLLQKFVTDEVNIPSEVKESTNFQKYSTAFIQKIMKQANVYIEEVDGSKLQISATSQVPLTDAKQLIRQLWDSFQGTTDTIAGYISETKDTKLGFFPIFDPYSVDPLYRDIVCWRIGPIKDLRDGMGLNSLFERREKAFHILTSENDRDSQYTEADIAQLSPFRDVIQHWVQSNPSVSASLRTSFGNVALFTPESVNETNIFAVPKEEGVSVPLLREWMVSKRPMSAFLHRARLPSFVSLSRPFTQDAVWEVIYSLERSISTSTFKNHNLTAKPDLYLHCHYNPQGQLILKRAFYRDVAVNLDWLNAVSDMDARTSLIRNSEVDENFSNYLNNILLKSFVVEKSTGRLYTPSTTTVSLPDNLHNDQTFTLKNISLKSKSSYIFPHESSNVAKLVVTDLVTNNGVVRQEVDVESIDAISESWVTESWKGYVDCVKAVLDEQGK